ncbi:MAG: glycerophosphodiester phosphodiesterase family protein [Myxococcota bacterium]
MLLPVLAVAAAPLVIGHRGSPGVLPDHVLEGYALAVEQGADAIEPDLVITKDGVLVARHENELSATTDVAERFPGRRRDAVIDGEPVTGWFAEDFTLAEIKTLRARQPWPDRPHDHDGRYAIPTFDEVLALADRLGRERGRPVIVVPETKHPTYFRSIGLPLEPPLIRSLRRHGRARDGVVLQSFELTSLETLGAALPLPRILLVGDTVPPLAELRAKVEGIGVPRELVWGAEGPTGLVPDAHAAGLLVYVYTFRAERPGPAGDGDPVKELAAFLALGVDGVFCDQPDLAVRARGK